MRAVALLLLLVGSASGEPKPDSKSSTKPVTVPHVKSMSEAQRGIELTPSIEYREVTKVPGFGGGTALGMVERPAWHNDMRDYAEGGMVIRPPNTADDMVIAPGTSWLSSGAPLRGLWNTLQYGIDRFWESLSPSAGGT
jgi:hypothetical protein